METNLLTVYTDIENLINDSENLDREAILDLVQTLVNDATSLQDEVEDLNYRLDSLREEIEQSYLDQITSLEEENSSLDSEIYDLNERLSELEEYEDLISSLREEVSALNLRNNLLETHSPFSAYIKELRSLTQKPPELDDVSSLAMSSLVNSYQQALDAAHSNYEGYSKGLATWTDLALAIRCAQVDTALNHPLEEGVSLFVRPTNTKEDKFRVSFKLANQEVLQGTVDKLELPCFVKDLFDINPSNPLYREENEFLTNHLSLVSSVSAGEIRKVTLKIFPDEFGRYNVNSFCEFKVYLDLDNRSTDSSDSNIELSCKLRFFHFSIAMAEVNMMIPT